MNKKTARNESLYRYWKARPDMSIAAIARIYHISRARAWLIIQSGKNEEEEMKCPKCGELLEGGEYANNYIQKS